MTLRLTLKLFVQCDHSIFSSRFITNNAIILSVQVPTLLEKQTTLLLRRKI